MYIPQHFQQQDSNRLAELMNAYPFAMLVSAKNGQPLVSHLPFIYDAERQVVQGHIARTNPQWQALEDGDEVLVVFNGPQGYISPAWYQSQDLVPTWNYIAVQISGTLTWLTDEATLVNILDQSTQAYEASQTHNKIPWSLRIPDDKKDMLLSMIAGFEITVDKIDGNFKLSQNRNDADFNLVLEALKQAPRPESNELADWMLKCR